MDSTTPNPCVLKVLSGPHKGAEVLLKPGTYTVGSSEECDLILDDSLFQGQHFKLTFKPPVVTLEVLAGITFVNGKRVNEEPVEVAFFQFITVGTTQIVIGPDGGGWPLLSAEDAPALDLSTPTPKAVQEDAKADLKTIESTDKEEESAEANPETLAEAMALASGKTTNTNENLIDPLPAKEKVSWREIIENRIIQLGVAAALAIGIAVFVFYPQGQKPIVTASQPVLSMEERTKKLQDIVRLNHFQDELKVVDVEGQLTVSGYLKKESDRQNLHRAIAREDSKVSFHVQSEENLVSTAQKLLSGMGVPVRVEPSVMLGSIRSVGYVADSENWQKAKNLLLSDLDHLQNLEDKVLTGYDINRFIRPLLKAKGLSAAVEVIPQDDKIRVMGTLTHSQGEAWDEIAVQLDQYVADQVPIRYALVRSEPRAITDRYFDTSIQSLTTGPFGYVALQGGEKYFTGSVLPSGYVIVSVENDGITLRKGDAEVIFKPHQS